jgi:acetate kinase
MRILVLNSGSSSVKFGVFGDDLGEVHSGRVTEIGGRAMLAAGGRRVACVAPDHRAALAAVFAELERAGIMAKGLTAAAHRVVHGGPGLSAACPITQAIEAEIEACAALAPLHNPHNLAGIRAVAALAPDLVQFASFDTAFHATIPAVATRLALPDRAATAGLRRYGFHGLSYASLVGDLPLVSGAPLPRRVLAFHLGNGASACAILDGRSVGTTMGYSPLDGLLMGTRAGSLDPEVVLTLAERMGAGPARAMLNRDSGLLALAGQSDMKLLLDDPGEVAAGAVEAFCQAAARHGAGLIPAMGGIDAIAFTGGIGEHAAPVRARIVELLGWAGARIDPAANAEARASVAATASALGIWIVPAREERRIAADAALCLAEG